MHLFSIALSFWTLALSQVAMTLFMKNFRSDHLPIRCLTSRLAIDAAPFPLSTHEDGPCGWYTHLARTRTQGQHHQDNTYPSKTPPSTFVSCARCHVAVLHHA